MLMALSVLVDYHALRGEAERASHYADQAISIGRQVTAPDMQVLTPAMLGCVHQARGELREAIECFRSALSMLPGDSFAWARQRAEYLAEIAEAYQALGDVQSAREAWTTALDLLDRAGHPLAAQVRSRLRSLADPSAG